MNNDLGAATLSVYFNWYLTKIALLSPSVSGVIFLIGQVVDGIATVAVGFASDKIMTRFGKRMPWYFFGSLMVITGFAGLLVYPNFVHMHDLDGNPRNESLAGLYYMMSFICFNVGWAFV